MLFFVHSEARAEGTREVAQAHQGTADPREGQEEVQAVLTIILLWDNHAATNVVISSH